jgi:hypothetical protein
MVSILFFFGLCVFLILSLEHSISRITVVGYLEAVRYRLFFSSTPTLLRLKLWAALLVAAFRLAANFLQRVRWCIQKMSRILCRSRHLRTLPPFWRRPEPFWGSAASAPNLPFGRLLSAPGFYPNFLNALASRLLRGQLCKPFELTYTMNFR